MPVVTILLLRVTLLLSLDVVGRVCLLSGDWDMSGNLLLGGVCRRVAGGLLLGINLEGHVSGQSGDDAGVEAGSLPLS